MFLPTMAERDRPIANFMVWIEYEKSPARIGVCSDRNCARAELFHPVSDFRKMAAFPTGIVMVDYGGSSHGQRLRLSEGNLFAETGSTPPILPVIDEAVVGVSEYEIASRQLPQYLSEPFASPDIALSYING